MIPLSVISWGSWEETHNESKWCREWKIMSWIWLIFPAPHFSKKKTLFLFPDYMIQLHYKSTLSTHSLSSWEVYKNTYYNSTLPDKELRYSDHQRLTSMQKKNRHGDGWNNGKNTESEFWLRFLQKCTGQFNLRLSVLNYRPRIITCILRHCSEY